ncbi:hypothetical protein B0H12DRAFT_1246924 [Mycena haematopus]|nr:hypothetical protein B0H12DRAFT_1246924 [Mycena haematopus]
MALIFGHHRQSSVVRLPSSPFSHHLTRSTGPFLTDWHKRNQARVDEFLSLHIVKLPISQTLSALYSLGLLPDSKPTPNGTKHATESARSSDFSGTSVSTPGFPVNDAFTALRMLIPKTKSGSVSSLSMSLIVEACTFILHSRNVSNHRAVDFNHTQYTWLVIWEADVAVELPPWTAALYPSALFYHFNLDVHQIQFVTTDGRARPTRENSRPIEAGDDMGRGSFVFFNQSTMRHGPETGFNTLKEAKAHGHSGVSDYGASAQEAFSKHVVFRPVTRDDFE